MLLDFASTSAKTDSVRVVPAGTGPAGARARLCLRRRLHFHRRSGCSRQSTSPTVLAEKGWTGPTLAVPVDTAAGVVFEGVVLAKFL